MRVTCMCMSRPLSAVRAEARCPLLLLVWPAFAGGPASPPRRCPTFSAPPPASSAALSHSLTALPSPHPPLYAAFAWVMLGERLGAKGFAGAGIILASSLVTQVLGSEPKSEEEDAAEPMQLAPQLVDNNKHKRE